VRRRGLNGGPPFRRLLRNSASGISASRTDEMCTADNLSGMERHVLGVWHVAPVSGSSWQLL
jgi:hypothetical protein